VVAVLQIVPPDQLGVTPGDRRRDREVGRERAERGDDAEGAALGLGEPDVVQPFVEPGGAVEAVQQRGLGQPRLPEPGQLGEHRCDVRLPVQAVEVGPEGGVDDPLQHRFVDLEPHGPVEVAAHRYGLDPRRPAGPGDLDEAEALVAEPGLPVDQAAVGPVAVELVPAGDRRVERAGRRSDLDPAARAELLGILEFDHGAARRPAAEADPAGGDLAEVVQPGARGDLGDLGRGDRPLGPDRLAGVGLEPAARRIHHGGGGPAGVVVPGLGPAGELRFPYCVEGLSGVDALVADRSLGLPPVRTAGHGDHGTVAQRDLEQGEQPWFAGPRVEVAAVGIRRPAGEEAAAERDADRVVAPAHQLGHVVAGVEQPAVVVGGRRGQGDVVDPVAVDHGPAMPEADQMEPGLGRPIGHGEVGAQQRIGRRIRRQGVQPAVALGQLLAVAVRVAVGIGRVRVAVAALPGQARAVRGRLKEVVARGQRRIELDPGRDLAGQAGHRGGRELLAVGSAGP
jgi:hypothetical protein